MSMIKFKLTAGHSEPIELAYEPARTVGQYIEDLADLYDAEPDNFKLVFKGKILTWKQKASEAKLQNGTVMVVINNAKKQPKKVVPSAEQKVPGAGMSTGLGASSPFGVGGYGMVNHPQYMSAISSAVDPDKMEEILDDPQTQGMLEQILDDPDTLRQLMEENPMIRSMLKDNPQMKMMFQNPALMKMILNKDMLKKSAEIMKNGGDPSNPQEMAEKMMMGSPAQNGGQAGQVGMAQMGQMGQMGMGMGQPGFGSFGNFMNPFMFGMQPNQANPSQSGGSIGSGESQAQSAGQQSLQTMLENSFFERTYALQLRELEEYGFKDRVRNLRVLREVKGDVDLAMEKLCSQQ